MTYNVGIEDIGELVRVNGKTGYRLTEIRYSPGGLQAVVVYTTQAHIQCCYMLEDLSKG